MKNKRKEKIAPDLLEEQLRQLERAPVDELATLATPEGVQALDGWELLALKADWEYREEAIVKRRRQLLRVLVCSPIWLVIGGLAAWLAWPVALMRLVLLFPLSVLAYMVGLFYLHFRYGDDAHRRSQLRAIDREFERRSRRT